MPGAERAGGVSTFAFTASIRPVRAAWPMAPRPYIALVGQPRRGGELAHILRRRCGEAPSTLLDRAEPAARAAEELAEVVAGDVLHHLAARVRPLPVGPWLGYLKPGARGQDERPLGAVDKLDAEALFELVNNLAGARLRDVVFASGPRKAALAPLPRTLFGVPLDLEQLGQSRAKRQEFQHSAMVSAKSGTAIEDVRKVFGAA